MPDLSALFSQYGSDKNNHNFAPLYERYLPDKVENFIEVGVFKGGGISAFQEWYNNEGIFYALNQSFQRNGVPSEKWFQDRGMITLKGFQQDVEFLSSIDVEFDVIVDDASHHSDDQIITFKHMFKNNLKPGGLYVLEDLHCCKEDWWWHEIKSFEDTFLGVAIEVLNSGDWTSQMFSPADNEYFSTAVRELVLINPPDTPPGSQGGGIAFIWKAE